MKRATASIADQVRFRRARHLVGVELVTATYRQRHFPPHTHQEYVFGAMTAGAEILSIRGEDHIVDQDRLILIGPDEVHANRGATAEPFGYAVMYVPAQFVAEAILEYTGRHDMPLLRFRKPAPTEAALRSRLLRTHSILTGDYGPLEQESAMLLFLGQLLKMHDLAFPQGAEAIDCCAVSRAQDYMDVHFRDSFALPTLARVAGISRFHLIRCFKTQIGMTPAAYQTQLRVREAKRLIKDGCSIALAAAEVGFADQSHLSRHFQRFVGTSPGRYAQQ